MWKGRLWIGEVGVPVKLYAAVEDRKIHFRMLHAPDRVPVQQRWVRKSDGREVSPEELHRAYPVDPETAVMLREEELEALDPEPSRDIRLVRFLPPERVDDRWYDRPYLLGPDGDEGAYFALAEALERKKLEGVARWVMRKRRHVGALRLVDGYPALITLRRADQIVSVEGVRVPERARPDAKELALARQLVAALEDDFDPAAWHDEYRARVERLLEAKARGERYELPRPPRKREGGDLAASLKRSLRAARGRKVA